MIPNLKEEVHVYYEKQLKLEKEEQEKKSENGKNENWRKKKRNYREKKGKKNWKQQFNKLLDDYGDVSPSPSKTRSGLRGSPYDHSKYSSYMFANICAFSYIIY